MDFEKAIKILGLRPDFNEEEFKKAYRRLSHECHPDKPQNRVHPEENIKRQQEINAAKDYLKDYLKEHNIDLDKYRQQKVSELNDITSFKFSEHKVSEKLKSLINEIGHIVLAFGFDTVSATDKKIIDNKFQESIRMITYKFREFETEFYRENNIDKNDVKENIDYHCTLKEFYEQLLKIKEKYSKESQMMKKLEEETSKYKDYVGYDKIEKLIEICINNALIKIRRKGFMDIQKDIEEMHQAILECFQIYFYQNQKINSLGEIIKDIDDTKIQSQYKNLNTEFERGVSFLDIEDLITDLEKLINEYQKQNQRKIDFKENEQTINQIYKSLMTRYSDVLRKYNIVTEYEAINNLNNFLKGVLELFRKGCDKYESLDYFNLFNEINFESITNDSKIIKTIIQRLKLNNYKVYIKKSYTTPGDEFSFFWFDEEKMTMYKVEPSYISHKEINYEELEEDYISLKEFLDKSTFVGENRVRLDMKSVILLYEMNGRRLYFTNNEFKIMQDITLMSLSSQSTKHNEYQNKEYVYSLIEEQVKKRVEEYNEPKDKKNTR